VYLNTASHITALTESMDEISAITVMAGTANKFQRIQADMDSIQFTSEGSFKSSGGYEQALVMRFNKPRKEMVTLLKKMRDQVVCGVAAIYVDNNAQAWLLGANDSKNEGLTRPINEVEISLDTGVLMTDEDAQSATVTLKRIGGFLPSPFNAALTTSITDGTAPFINWT
jgi:hypothetical protein